MSTASNWKTALIGNIVAGGLGRKLDTDPVRWGQKHVQLGPPIPGPLTFKHHPWLEEPLRTDAHTTIAMKGAQLGFSITAIVRTLYELDMHQTSVLYLLPTQRPDANEFASTKLDPLISASPHLQNLFTNISNVSVKRAGPATLYIRGANSRNALKSISVGRIVFDEFDEMPPENIPLAEERMSGQFRKCRNFLSTPTVPGLGIDLQFQASTREYFYFDCPFCSISVPTIVPNYNIIAVGSASSSHSAVTRPTKIKLDPESFKLVGESLTDPRLKDSFIETPCCHKPLSQALKAHCLATSGRYIAENPDADPERRGFSVNQLYSPTINMYDLAMLVMQARSNPAYEQELNNSKWARPHKVSGASVEEADLISCTRDYATPVAQHQQHPAFSVIGSTDRGPAGRTYNNQGLPDVGARRFITLGIDVGVQNYWVVREFQLNSISRDLNLTSKSAIRAYGRTRNFQDLHQIMREFQVQFAVIDAQPERRLSISFARAFPGFVRACFYATATTSRTIQLATTPGEDNEFKVTADRTFWMDTVGAAFHSNRILLPNNMAPEFRSQIKAPVRLTRPKRSGEIESFYLSTSDDHYYHALVYSEIALPLAVSGLTNSDVSLYL